MDMKKRSLIPIWIGALAASFCLTAIAANPVPVLEYDFSKNSNGIVSELGGTGLELKLGENTRLIKTEEGEALEFNGSKESIAAGDQAKFKKWKQQISTREISAAFWIRFDSSIWNRIFGSSAPSGAASLGLFDCRLDEEKHLQLRLFAKPENWDAVEYIMKSSEVLETGKWYHVEFNYSQNKRRASLYIDGKFQFENNNLHLPELAFGELKFGEGFQGGIGAFKLYNMALDSEDLAICKVSEAEAAKQQKAVSEAGKKFSNKYFDSWCKELAKTIDLLRNSKKTTTGEWRRLKNDIANAAKLANGLANNKNALSSGVLSSYTVPAMSQEMRLPYNLPTDGSLSNQIQLAAALGEFEPASFVVVPFAPLKKFELKISDLKNGSNVIPASAIDAKLVKRWYRCGGAWLTYHADKRQRVLVPSMLLNDENLIKVDELKQTNEVRLSYPDGAVYKNVSKYSKEGDPYFNYALEPVLDASSLQPVALPEAGRNQQFWLTFHIPQKAAPGIYDGTIKLIADGQDAGELKLSLRVLPFELPEAKTHYDLERVFHGNITYVGLDVSKTKDRKLAEKRTRAELKNLAEHNALYPCGPNLDFDTESFISELKLREEAGLPNRPLFTGHAGDQLWRKTPYTERTDEVLHQCQTIFSRNAKMLLDLTEKTLGHHDVYFYGNDEASGYVGLVTQQEPGWNLIKELGGKTRAAGWQDNFRYVADNQDQHNITSIDKRHAELWHSVGARLFNYADPFAGAENPLWFRRKMGMMMYLANYDGTFFLSYYNSRIAWNEFAEDPGGDGNYRNFAIVYPKLDGVIDTIAWEGMREAFDDIRYATLLKQLAQKGMASKNREIEREAKRQIAWLEQVDSTTGNLDTLRLAMIDRILTMIELQKNDGGK